MLVALVSMGLLASCAQSTDVQTAAQAKPVAKKDEKQPKVVIPKWVTAGFAMAEREIARRKPLTRPEADPNARVQGLPSRPEFIALLTAAGVNPQSAGCIYDNVSVGPVAEHAEKLFGALANSSEEERQSVAGGTLAELDQPQLQQFLVAIAPCMDPQTLVALVASTGGKMSGDGSALDAFGLGGLDGLNGAQLASLLVAYGGAPAGADILATAAAAGITLTAGQAQALTGAVAANAIGQAAGLDPKSIDFDKIDTSKMTPETVGVLLLALARGLTDPQRQQLATVSNLNLANLDLAIDPDKLTAENGGALLLVLMPFLSAQLAPQSGGAPPGIDPGQVYVPPGSDLSGVNPLLFVKRENLISGLMRDGVAEPVAGCMYDKLRLIDPGLLSLAFTGQSLAGGSQLLLTIIGCTLRI